MTAQQNGDVIASRGYAYDELDRLVREDDGATAREYDYDLAGNRTAMRVIAGGVTNATAYTLGGGNRLASWTGGGACAYDTAGCVTNLVRSGKPAVALEWDAQYRVTAAYTNGVLAESYGYDALGRRATVTAGGVATHYVNEGPHVVAETDAAGNLLRRYEYGPGVDDILTMTAFSGGATNTYRYVKDIQNTVLAIRDGAGEVVESYEYDAWGNVLAVRDGTGNLLPASAIGNRFLFQGREYSWATGLYNFRARWYDPETGRWMSNDPIGISGGLNLYAFCGNNPVNFIDPNGRAVQAVVLYVLGKGLIGGAEGALSGGLAGLFDSPTGNLNWKNAGKGMVTGFAGGFVAGAVSSVPVIGDIAGGAAGGWVSAVLYSKWQGIPLDSDRGKAALAFGAIIGAGGGAIDSFNELPLAAPIAAGLAGGGYNMIDNLLQNTQRFVDGANEEQKRKYEDVCP